MGASSGFFEAMYDSEQGAYDRTYLAEQFANYFKLFIGNGVFASPTNQLKVIPGIGLSVMIASGWAMINGYWYHVDSPLQINITNNPTSLPRRDTIILRMSLIDRTIEAYVLTGSTDLNRGDNVYDIALAYVDVAPGAVTISASNITDKRGDASVCGFVTGLLKVETTEDLFSQLNAQFNEWFDTVKDQVTGDLAIRLQQEFTQINEDIVQYHKDVEDSYAKVNQDIAKYKQDVDNSEAAYKNELATQQQTHYNNLSSKVDQYNQNYTNTLNATRKAAEDAQDLVDELTDRDFVIPEQRFTFVNNVCNIPNSKITPTTLIDVYFTQESINEAIRCSIYVESENGNIKLTAGRTPSSEIRGIIGVRVR